MQPAWNRNEEPGEPMREVVAAEIRALMGRHRVSQTRLAQELGMAQSRLSARLCGQKAFDVDELEVVAAYFNVPVTTLFGAALQLPRYLSPVPNPGSAWQPSFDDALDERDAPRPLLYSLP